MVDDSQLVHALVRNCLDAGKVMFLLKGTNPKSTPAKEGIANTEAAIWSTMEDCVGMPLAAAHRLQCSLPMRKGGCGIKLPGNFALPARLSLLLSYPKKATNLGVPQRWITYPSTELTSLLSDAQSKFGSSVAPFSTWASRPSTISTAAPEYQLQSWWAEKVVSMSQKSLVNTMGPDGRDAVRLQQQLRGSGSGWMKAAPSAPLGAVIGNDDYQLGLRWWLGMHLLPDLPADARCPRCGQQIDPYGDHLMCCRNNNFAARHGALQSTIIDILMQARQPCEREVA